LAHNRKIAVIGLGYVGLPVAVAFARTGAPVIGFDIDRVRIDELRASRDRTREVDAAELAQPGLSYTDDAAALAAADFFIVTVPTPIDAANRPDLSAMLAASKTVGGALKHGDIVVYESTVYPGAVSPSAIRRSGSILATRRIGSRPSPRSSRRSMRKASISSPTSTARPSRRASIVRPRSRWPKPRR
jgi:nucleotide sugar dehydrogenase